MTKITLDASMCRQKTTIIASVNERNNIDISVETLCQDVARIMNSLPQNIDPNVIFTIKYDVLPELIMTCPTVPGAGCPFICVAYKAIEAEARLFAEKA